MRQRRCFDRCTHKKVDAPKHPTTPPRRWVGQELPRGGSGSGRGTAHTRNTRDRRSLRQGMHAAQPGRPGGGSYTTTATLALVPPKIFSSFPDARAAARPSGPKSYRHGETTPKTLWLTTTTTTRTTTTFTTTTLPYYHFDYTEDGEGNTGARGARPSAPPIIAQAGRMRTAERRDDVPKTARG